MALLAAMILFMSSLYTIEEGFKQKPRQRLSRLFGGQIFVNSLPRNYFASVDLEELD